MFGLVICMYEFKVYTKGLFSDTCEHFLTVNFVPGLLDHFYLI